MAGRRLGGAGCECVRGVLHIGPLPPVPHTEALPRTRRVLPLLLGAAALHCRR